VEVIERLVELLVILAGAKVGAEVMTRLRQPAVIGELVVGMVIGASVLGWIAVEDGDVISIMAEIGVILLLFEVGLETDVRDFVRLGGSALSVASIGVLTPFALGFAAAKLLAIDGGSTEVALFIAAAMTATSVGITARVFADLKRLQTDEAKTIIGAAVIDDIMGLIILAVVVGVLGADGSFAITSVITITAKALFFLAGVVVIGIPLVRFYFRFLGWLRVEGSYVVGAFAFAVAVGIAAEEIAGLDPIVGAFAAGLVAAQSGHHERLFRELRPIVYLFVPIFFLSIGARVDVDVLTDPKVLMAGGVVSMLAIVGKIVSGLGVWGGADRWVVGVGMIPRGEVGLIFAALGSTQLAAVVGPEETAIVVMMVVVTTLVAPIVLNRMLRYRPLPAAPTPAGLEQKLLDSPMLGGREIDEAPPDRRATGPPAD
jgi:Kef-type K+ transport system membrane component KefB